MCTCVKLYIAIIIFRQVMALHIKITTSTWHQIPVQGIHCSQCHVFSAVHAIPITETQIFTVKEYY